MKIEDFGFQPVMGKEYVVSFTKDGELLSTSIYNGSDLPAVSFPDNAKIVFTVTDKETGKQLMNTEFISYNGKLYKSVFNLPLKNPDTNKNANVYIKDLHYDLTTGSVLVQVQGFQGDKYNLTVSDATMKHKVMAMPITLEDDMYYSIPTELVQGNTFEVLLQDEFGKSVDYQEFTAPISTDWRFTATLEDGTLVLDGESPEGAEEPPADGEAVPDQIDETTGNMTLQNEVTEEAPVLEQTTEQDSFLPDAVAKYEKPIVIGAVVLVALLLLILIMRMLKRKSRKAEEATVDYDEEDDELEELEDEEEEEEEEDEEEEEEDEEKPENKKPKK